MVRFFFLFFNLFCPPSLTLLSLLSLCLSSTFSLLSSPYLTHPSPLLSLPLSTLPTHLFSLSLSFPHHRLIVFASFIVHFVALGIVYSFGVFFLPIEEEFGASRADVAWVGSIVIGVMLLASANVGQFMRRFGGPLTVGPSTALLVVGGVLTSYAKELWQMYLCSIIAGVVGYLFLFISLSLSLSLSFFLSLLCFYFYLIFSSLSFLSLSLLFFSVSLSSLSLTFPFSPSLPPNTSL